MFLLERKLERTTAKLDACQAAVRSLCSQPPSAGELQQIYEAIAPGQDEYGFSLYFAAKHLTGIDVPSHFPYEENQGLFESAKGSLLLRYLTAARFGAVTWEVVPGTCYKKAILGTVDTSTEEYQTFERELYEKALEWLGFQDILIPGQGLSARENKTTELKLYSHLSGKLTDEKYNDPHFIDGRDLLRFQTAIRQEVEDTQLAEEAERGLMLYFDGLSAVDEKVVSFFPTVEEVDGELYGVAVCQIRGTLNPAELEELKEYCHAQYNDAWGEEFAQRPHRTEHGDLYVSFYIDSSDSILAKEELFVAKTPSRPQQPKDRGDQHER